MSPDSPYQEMLWAAESVYEGTWGGDDPPLEVLHYELMRDMGWTWRDLEETPAYVVRYCKDLMLTRRQAEREAQERANKEAQRGHGA